MIHDTASSALLLAAAVLLAASALTSRRQRRLVHERRASLIEIVDAAPDGVLISDECGQIEFVNQTFLEMSDLERADLIGRRIEELVTDGHRERLACHPEVGVQDPRACSMDEATDISLRRRDGVETPVEIRSIPAAIDGATHVISIVRDAREQKRLAERVGRLALYDSLTDLPNHALFQRRLMKSIEAAAVRGLKLAVLCVNLDRFKHVNDVFGHEAGDHLLRTVAERMVGSVRSGDGVSRVAGEEPPASVSRIGGDEFIVLLSGIRHPEDAAKVAERILDRLFEPISIRTEEIRTSASIGVSIYPRDGHDAETLVRCADAAMYQAKSSGRHRYRFFDAELDETVVRRHRVAVRLGIALEEEKLRLHYQPLVSTGDRRVTGGEALLRWNDEVLGSMSPSEFIAVAEDTGLVPRLGEWVLREVCRQIRRWRQAGHRIIPVSVNVSAHQLRMPAFPASVARALHAEKLSTANLSLEITETAILGWEPIAMANLAELRRMGLKVVLDDFGTGFSSLTHLVQLPISGVKIDRTFVARVAEDERTAAVVSGLLALARRLGLSVTAEGVESEQQLRFLAANGCEDFQGYLVSPAVAPEDFARWLGDERPAP